MILVPCRVGWFSGTERHNGQTAGISIWFRLATVQDVYKLLFGSLRKESRSTTRQVLLLVLPTFQEVDPITCGASSGSWLRQLPIAKREKLRLFRRVWLSSNPKAATNYFFAALLPMPQETNAWDDTTPRLRLHTN